MGVLSRHRLAAFVVLVLVAVGAVALAIQTAGNGSGGDAPSLPEGGSSFGGSTAAGTASPEPAPATVEASGSGSGSVKPPAGQERQLAQLFLVGFRGRSTDDAFFARLAKRRWGAVIVDGSNYRDNAQLITLTEKLNAVLRDAGAPAPLIAAQQGGGSQSTLPGLPPAAQPTIGSLAEARAEATRASGKLRRLGIRMVLAPSADVGYSGGAGNGRAFSEDPDAVVRRASGAIAGWRTGGVAPAVGHFPGEGAASQDPAEGPASVGLAPEQLQGADLKVFDALLGTVPALVLSNALYVAYDAVTPATLLPEIPAIARRSGFKGMIVSGNLAATVLASGGPIADAAVAALKAGSDLLWIPGDARDQEAAYRAVVRAVRSGEISQTRVRDALARVKTLKRKYAGG